MLKIFKNLFEFFKLYKIINKFVNQNFKIVFYSENKIYQKYSYILLNSLADKYPNQVLYASSDKNDIIDNEKITNLYVGKQFSLQYFFLKLKAKNLFTTTIDIGNNILSKTKKVNNYIYYFHSPVSTTKVYTAKAFDNYDTILCIGGFQKNEIQKREQIKGINKKKLIEAGYFYFDYLNNKIHKNFDSEEVLLAPSWNYNEKNFINEDFDLVIEHLIKNDFKVRFRPHPEHFKRSLKFINYLKAKYFSKNFIFDDEIENFSSMQKAKCLITDNSGIAIEYVLILKKPTFYFQSKNKIHNTDVNEFKDMLNIEEHIKKKFGYTFDRSGIENLKTFIIENLENHSDEKLLKIDNFLEQNFYNYNNTAKFLIKNIENIII